jgi:hypothetical protein
MKALAMLDHVMLWVARGFAIFALGWAISEMDESFSHDYWISKYVVAGLLASVLWVAASWSLRKDTSRLYLGLSGALLFSLYFCHLMDLLFMHPYPPFGRRYFSIVWLLIGFLAIAWTGFRAPGFSSLKLTPIMKGKNRSDSRTSTSSSLFRNSLPSVNLEFR